MSDDSEVKECKYDIYDEIQKNYDLTNYSLIADIILAVSIYYSYLYLPGSQFNKLLKYYILIIFVRYFISKLTTIEINTKKYFQMSSHMSLFILTLLIALDNNLFGYSDNINYLVYSSIAIYGIMLSVFKIQFSADVLNTAILTLFIYKSDVFKMFENKPVSQFSYTPLAQLA